MMKTTRWLSGCLLAGGLMGLLVSQARAAHPDVEMMTAGMLTFYAVAEVESPTDSQVVASPHTFVNNPTIEANRNHKVKITGPPNEGNINIDYILKFELDSTNVIGSTSITDTMAGLDGSGLWIQNPVYSASLSVTTGYHDIFAWSYIKFRPNGNKASIGHTHLFRH